MFRVAFEQFKPRFSVRVEPGFSVSSRADALTSHLNRQVRDENWKELLDIQLPYGDVSHLPQKTDEQLRHKTVNYYGKISLTDHNIDRIVAVLHEMGFEENALIFFTSNHGDFMDDHGLYMKRLEIY